MKRIIALVGRPNVGKSTLFNCLTHSRDALVAPESGLTRDRRYGQARFGDHAFIVIDTGGLTGENDGIDGLIAGQVDLAIEEADVIFFVVDGKEPINAMDEQIAARLRAVGKPLYLVVNKSEGVNKDLLRAEYSVLGVGQPYLVSAVHTTGTDVLLGDLATAYPDSLAGGVDEAEGIKVAIIGRPNVGKSTLVNRLLGEERVLAYDMPGTTRDSIYIPFEREGERFVLIDTAGIRRRARVTDKLEKYSIIKTLQAIDAANVVILVLDAKQGIGHQDAGLLGFAVEQGKALVIAINKWDGLTPEQKETAKRETDLKISFIDFAPIFHISALHGTGVGLLFKDVKKAYESAQAHFPTPLLTRILEDAITEHQPPIVKGRRIKLRYAHQGGRNPPLIVIHGNQTENVPDTYRRFLANTFRERLKITGTPLFIEFKSGDNPYREKKNTLTPRQITKRKRLIKHIKSRKR
jgi:GTP-binding protein